MRRRKSDSALPRSELTSRVTQNQVLTAMYSAHSSITWGLWCAVTLIRRAHTACMHAYVVCTVHQCNYLIEQDQVQISSRGIGAVI